MHGYFFTRLCFCITQLSSLGEPLPSEDSDSCSWLTCSTTFPCSLKGLTYCAFWYAFLLTMFVLKSENLSYHSSLVQLKAYSSDLSCNLLQNCYSLLLTVSEILILFPLALANMPHSKLLTSNFFFPNDFWLHAFKWAVYIYIILTSSAQCSSVVTDYTTESVHSNPLSVAYICPH